MRYSTGPQWVHFHWLNWILVWKKKFSDWKKFGVLNSMQRSGLFVSLGCWLRDVLLWVLLLTHLRRISNRLRKVTTPLEWQRWEAAALISSEMNHSPVRLLREALLIPFCKFVMAWLVSWVQTHTSFIRAEMTIDLNTKSEKKYGNERNKTRSESWHCVECSGALYCPLSPLNLYSPAAILMEVDWLLSWAFYSQPR